MHRPRHSRPLRKKNYKIFLWSMYYMIVFSIVFRVFGSVYECLQHVKHLKILHNWSTHRRISGILVEYLSIELDSIQICGPLIRSLCFLSFFWLLYFHFPAHKLTNSEHIFHMARPDDLMQWPTEWTENTL